MKHLLLSALAIAGIAFVGIAQAADVVIATSNPGSLFHNIGLAVANAAIRNGMNTTIKPATSPTQFIPDINSGGVEFGIANLQDVNYAIRGEAWWIDNENDNLRIVGHLQPLVPAIFVHKDSGIMKVSELRGQPMTDGFTAQNTVLPPLSAIYATAGMTRDDVQKVSVASVVAGADAFIAGDTVGFIFAHGAFKVLETDATVGGLRALAVEDSSEASLAAVREYWPTAYFLEMQNGSMPGILEDGTYIAFPQVIFTHKSVPDNIVYEMAKAMYEQAEVMGKIFPPMRAFKPADMKGDPGIAEFHGGALKFFSEVGLN